MPQIDGTKYVILPRSRTMYAKPKVPPPPAPFVRFNAPTNPTVTEARASSPDESDGHGGARFVPRKIRRSRRLSLIHISEPTRPEPI
eukprot:8750953-Pyramimonas_sp.AAC.1